MNEEEKDYQKSLEKAAKGAKPDFNYKIDVNGKDESSTLLARGSILLEEGNNFKCKYRFIIGADNNVMVLDLYKGREDKEGTKDNFRKGLYNGIINFNEQLAKGVDAEKIRISANKINETIKNLYLLRGYKNNSNNTLEKRLK